MLMPIIPGLRRQTQGDNSKFQASLVFTGSRKARAHDKILPQENQNQPPKAEVKLVTC